jgi:hypothetical protein
LSFAEHKTAGAAARASGERFETGANPSIGRQGRRQDFCLVPERRS